jgi:hypothetical protein
MYHKLLITLLSIVTISTLTAKELAAAAPSRPFDSLEVMPLTEQIVMVYVVEGHVIHHQRGQKRGDSRVELTPLDVQAASKKSSWTIRSDGDPAYAVGLSPVEVGRKSKGVDFAWMIQAWDQMNNRAVNTDPDHAKAHCIYGCRPPCRQGKPTSSTVRCSRALAP